MTDDCPAQGPWQPPRSPCALGELCTLCAATAWALNRRKSVAKGNKHNGANKHIEQVKLELTHIQTQVHTHTHTQAEALMHVQLVIQFNNGSNNKENNSNIDNNNIDNNNMNNNTNNNS